VLTEKTISGSSTERVVRGPKGSFIRKHPNPRPVKDKIDWVQVFKDKYCGGSVDEYESVMRRFTLVNSRSSKQEANAIIGVYIASCRKNCDHRCRKNCILRILPMHFLRAYIGVTVILFR
jgi:hypothetical protein